MLAVAEKQGYILHLVPFYWAAPFTEHINRKGNCGMNRGPSKDNIGLTRILMVEASEVLLSIEVGRIALPGGTSHCTENILTSGKDLSLCQ